MYFAEPHFDASIDMNWWNSCLHYVDIAWQARHNSKMQHARNNVKARHYRMFICLVVTGSDCLHKVYAVIYQSVCLQCYGLCVCFRVIFGGTLAGYMATCLQTIRQSCWYLEHEARLSWPRMKHCLSVVVALLLVQSLGSYQLLVTWELFLDRKRQTFLEI